MSRALNPPQSAPLHHINSGTGTNCPTLDVLETQIASAASAPQLPPPLPNTPPQTEENPFKRRIAKLLVSMPGPFWVNRSCYQKASFVSLCYCIRASIQACFQNIALHFSAAHSFFLFYFFPLSCHSAALWFYFSFRKSTDKYSLCTSRFGETFPRIPSTAILLLNLLGTIRHRIVLLSDPRISYPFYHSEI